MAIKIREPYSQEEIILACNIYMAQNDFTFLRIDSATCLQSMMLHWKQLKYIKIIEKDKKIVGFIMASLVTSRHCAAKHVVQDYYCTNLSGISSALAVKHSHRDLLEYAKKMRAAFVISQSSHMDAECIFTKLLEKDGWQRRNYVAIKHLEPIPPRRLPSSGRSALGQVAT